MRTIPVMDADGGVHLPPGTYVPQGLTPPEISVYLIMSTDTTPYGGSDARRILKSYFSVGSTRTFFRAKASLKRKGLL